MIRVSVAGDLMCKGRQSELLLVKFGEYKFSDYVGELKPLFANSDYVIGNLETPVGGGRKAAESMVSFNTPVEFLDALKDVGFNFLSLANNHCLDCGVEGLCATIANVREKGFVSDGAFLSEEDSQSIRVVDVKGLKIAIVSSTFGTNSEVNGVMLAPEEQWRVALTRTQLKHRRVSTPEEPKSGDQTRTYIADAVSPVAIGNEKNEVLLERILSKIRRAKDQADFVIALPHVGGQYNPGPATYAKYVVKRMKEAGADVVVAGHPHVVHRCEPWKSGEPFCAYSLGNTCFTPGVGYFVPNTLYEYGVILHLYVDETRKQLAGVGYDVIKNVVDEDGLAHARTIGSVASGLRNATAIDRLQMEVECVSTKFSSGVKLYGN